MLKSKKQVVLDQPPTMPHLLRKVSKLRGKRGCLGQQKRKKQLLEIVWIEERERRYSEKLRKELKKQQFLR